MANKEKDTAIGTPQWNAGPRYPYSAVLWQGASGRILMDDTPQNAQDTSGGGKSYDTQPGGGGLQIAMKDGSGMEFSPISGRFQTRVTGQNHMSVGKGSTTSIEGSDDSRKGGGSRDQVGEDKVATQGGSSAKSAGEQNIDTSGKTRSSGTPTSSFNSTEKDSVGSASGSSHGQSRGDAVGMTKGNNYQATEGEWGVHVIGGNGSHVFQKSYKIHVDNKFKSDVHGSYDSKSTDVMTIESDAAIRFKVGDSSITIYPDHIHIKSEEVRIGGGGKVDIKAGDIKLGSGIVQAVGTLLGTWSGSGAPPETPDGSDGAQVGRD